MNEQRQNDRIGCYVPVEGKKGSDFDHTQTVDFSRGGLGFISDHNIPIGQEIMVELDLDKRNSPVFVVGKVTWVKYIKKSGTYRVGLSFGEVIQGSRSRLEKYFDK